jgi:hypothetical protein
VEEERQPETSEREAPMIFGVAMLPVPVDTSMSRRTFIKGAAVAVGAATLVAALAGCDGGDESTTTNAAASTTESPTTTSSEPPTTTTSEEPPTTDPPATAGGVICTCEAVCSCDGHCTCNPQGSSGGGHYWYPT